MDVTARHAMRMPSPFSRLKTAASAARILNRDPNRLDQVLAFNMAVNAGAIVRSSKRIEQMPGGAKLVAEKRQIDRAHVDYNALERLPDGTLGREYVRFLKANDITPDAFAELPDFPDERAAWIMLRMRQTHDL